MGIGKSASRNPLTKEEIRRHIPLALTILASFFFVPFMLQIILNFTDINPRFLPFNLHTLLDGEVIILSSIAGLFTILARVISGMQLHFARPKSKLSLFLIVSFVILSGMHVTYVMYPRTFCLPFNAPFGFFMCHVVTSSPYNYSFPGNVLVKTLHENVIIAELSVGDQVISFDTDTKTKTVAVVEAISSRTDTDFVIINDELRVTPLHPFAILSYENQIIWKEARAIATGDCLLTAAQCLKVTNIRREFSPEEQVYNIQVSGPKNYFVLIDITPVLVHNKTLPETIDISHMMQRTQGN